MTLLDERAPAPFGRQAIRRHVHDGLQDHVIVEHAFGKAVVTAAESLQIFANALLPDIDAFVRILDGSLGREEIGNLVPLTFVDIEAVGALEALDVVRILHPVGACFKVRDLRGARRRLRRLFGRPGLLRARAEHERDTNGRREDDA